MVKEKKKSVANKSYNKRQKRSYLRGMTLKSKIILLILLFTIIPSVMIGNVVYFVSSSTIENKVSDMNNEIGVQVTKNVNHLLREIENITLIPLSNMDLMEQLKNNEGLTEYERFTKEREVTEYFSSITFTNENAEALLFINEENIVFGESSTTDDFKVDEYFDSEIPDKVEELSGSVLWTSGLGDLYENIYLFRKYDQLGTLILIANAKLFDDVFENGRNTSAREISIINENGIIIASNKQKLVGSIYESQQLNDENLVSLHESENGWKVSVSTSKAYLLKEIHDVIYLVYILIFAFVLLSVFASIFLAKSMIRPIQRIVSIMKMAEKGDLTHRADYLYKNEVGQLGKSYNTMIDNITVMIEENKKVSTYAVNRANDLKRIAEESAIATEQIASAIEDVAKGAVSQVDYSERTNREMKELSAEINEVANNMERVSSITQTTKQLSSTSIETIKELTNKNQEMGTNIEQVEQTMNVLNEEITQIKDIVEIIKSVSEETNLLSLNASIEAARAGEYGRGFAVVAQEIRKLADQTKTSSLRIDLVIASILSQTKKSVQMVDTTIRLFNEQSNSIHDTQNAFENILEGTNAIISEIDYVEASIGKITINKEKVEKAINEMVEVAEISSSTTEEVTATTEEQAASAEELGDLASALTSTIQEVEELIHKFKVREQLNNVDGH
ncbi:methyl-accepting chemotaxis protein [uncultured Metabacillus sp.]|uniref:methyl-accepting chemotaxis protein n=1 Tax=uncultured Metabacillus sp. TaxID=2860135 RepID=UPI002611525E|nr:methyl-accepting chemotaxis protein [uncultured Metabacillus sp.]